jgi:2-keto-4-pentenoate hydratase/2-oxohepta-3-ene-1,7-dioic acid hydratase in catechol pathway
VTKYATFRVDGEPSRIGIVHEDAVFDLAAAAKRAGPSTSPFLNMLSLIDAGQKGKEDAERLFSDLKAETDLSLPLTQVDLLAPVPIPRQMRDGMSYPEHIVRSQRGMQLLGLQGEAANKLREEPLPSLPDVYRRQPIYYITNHLVVSGHEATVKWPRYSEVMDFELELGIFVGRTGANFTVSGAHDAIFGYTIFNDFSARDQQSREMPGWLGPAKGKSFNGSNVLGPWIVTPDEIGDPYSLRMQARVNGETWCDNTSAGMLFSFEEILVYMSQDETIQAGEFIGSGTVGGGCGLEQGRFLGSGDAVELEVDRIGTLRNKVVR